LRGQDFLDEVAMRRVIRQDRTAGDGDFDVFFFLLDLQRDFSGRHLLRQLVDGRNQYLAQGRGVNDDGQVRANRSHV